VRVRLLVDGNTKDGSPVEMSKTFDSESIRLANYDILKSAFDRMYQEVNRHIDKLNGEGSE